MSSQTQSIDPVLEWIDRITKCNTINGLKSVGAEVAKEIREAIEHKKFGDNVGIIKIRNAYVRHLYGDQPTAHELFHPLIEATKGDHFSFG